METYIAACIQLSWVIEPGFLWWELAATTTSLQTIVASSNVLSRTPTSPENTLLHATGTHPPTDITPSTSHVSYSLIKHSTSLIIGRLLEVDNIIRIFVWILCPPGAQTGVFVVEKSDALTTGPRLLIIWFLQLSDNFTNAHYANDTLLHIIATHSLAHNTLPALQKTSTHSASFPTAFSPTIHNVKVDKFRVLGNGHVSSNGNLLCCPYLTLLGYRARNSVVGPRWHNHFVADICWVVQTYQAELQLALNKLCYMPLAPTHHLHHTFFIPISNLPYSKFLHWPQAMDWIHTSFPSYTG